MSDHTAEIPATDASTLAVAETGPEQGVRSPAAPESIQNEVEAMLLSAGRTVPFVRLAVALGLISPEAAQEGHAAAAAESGVVEQAIASEGGEATAVQKSPRRRGKSKSAPVDAEGIIAKAVDLLNEQYQKTGRSFRIERIAGGYRFITLAKYAKVLAAFHQDRESMKLSRQAIETLAIIAYRQPITRAELESIRGVACGEVLRSLMERRLIAIVGRSEELGRPMLYGTTKHFLDAFGLASLKDLPSAADLKSAL